MALEAIFEGGGEVSDGATSEDDESTFGITHGICTRQFCITSHICQSAFDWWEMKGSNPEAWLNVLVPQEISLETYESSVTLVKSLMEVGFKLLRHVEEVR